MSVVYIIGDGHLAKIYEQAIADNKCLNFDQPNVKCIWEKDITQIKGVSDKFKDLNSKNKVPDGVVILCGGYDLILNKDPKDVAHRIRKLTQQMLSSGVKQIIVCSIIDRPIEAEANKLVKLTNRNIAYIYKGNKNVYFLNIRPPGKPIDFYDSDKFYLKPEGNQHIYTRLKNALSQEILSKLNNTTSSSTIAASTAPDAKEKDKSDKSHEITLTSELPIIKRMAEFEEILKADYKRICKEEDRITIEFNTIKNKLEETRKEKNAIASNYKKLFNTDLSL